MDPALPPGGLDQIFRQFDDIRSHGRAPDNPPWEPEEDAVSAPPQAAAEPPQAPPTEVTGTLTPLDASDGRVTLDRPGRPASSLSDSTGARPKGRPRSWTEDAATKAREAVGARNQEFAFNNPNRGTFAKDEDGLELAYHDVNHATSYDPKNRGTYYDPSTRTMYVRGSVTKQDWNDDFTKIPVWGDSRKIEMYQNAKGTYEDLIAQGKPVDRVVGHSLGGSVALQLQKDKDIPFSRTFGAPVVDGNMFQKNVERYRHPWDPVSILDRGATNTLSFDINKHSYGGFTNATSVFGKFLGA